MSKKKSAARQNVVMLTFTDVGNGEITIKLTFANSVNANAKTTPAEGTALKALELITDYCNGGKS